MNTPIPTLTKAAPRRRAALLARVAGVAIAAAMLGGCAGMNRTVAELPYPTEVRDRHPITIAEGARTHELFVGSGRGVLTPPQSADLMAFAREWKREATGGIVIETPAGAPNEVASAHVAREAHAALAQAGVPAHAIAIRSYRHGGGPDYATIRVSYPRVRAEAGPCGQWPHDLGPAPGTQHFQNRPYYNLGCATQRNVAAMVDNPADLVQPRGETGVYAPRRQAVFDSYGQGKETSSERRDQNAGRISDIGR
jgi:pilus assembly protein CpaD